MDKVRLILTLVSIAIVVVPIVGVLLAYQGNLMGLFVPPEITQIADDFMDGGDGGGNGDGRGRLCRADRETRGVQFGLQR